jgi:hypothetical protein
MPGVGLVTVSLRKSIIVSDIGDPFGYIRVRDSAEPDAPARADFSLAGASGSAELRTVI